MDVKILSPNDSVAFVRNHPDMYLGKDCLPTADVLVTSVVGDAVILGVDLIVVERAGQSCFIFGNSNWIKMGRKQDVSYIDIFNKIHSFPKAGQNSIRSEILVTAFSSDVVVIEKDHVFPIKGEMLNAPPLKDLRIKLNYGIGFVMPDKPVPSR